MIKNKDKEDMYTKIEYEIKSEQYAMQEREEEMTENKPIETCEFFNICETDCGGTLEDIEICSCYELYKQLARKEQECGKWKNAYEVKEDALEEVEEYIEELEEKCHKLQEQLKAENETYKKMLDNPEVHVALTDVRTGERDLWQKYKSRMEQAEQKIEKIRKLAISLCYKTIPNGAVILQEDILQIIEEVK